MNKLFEEYIYIQCRKAAKKNEGYRVYYQKGKRFWKNKKIVPDIIIEGNKGNTVIDAKWKSFKYESLDADLKQIYTYSIYWNANKSFLVFPSAVPAAGLIKEKYIKNKLLEEFETELNILPVSLVNESGLNREIGEEILREIQ